MPHHRTAREALALRACAGLSVILLLLSALSTTGCGGPRGGSGAVTELQQSIRESADASLHEETLELVERMLAINPDPANRVMALGKALQATRALRRDDDFLLYVNRLDEALGALEAQVPYGEVERNSLEENAYQEAEVGLRELQAFMYYRWEKGEETDVVLQNFERASEVYRGHLPDTILYADVLWLEGEFLYRSRRNMDAVPVYEAVLVKDFQGKHQIPAQGRLADIWVEESGKTPLPTDISAPTPIPSPHKDWMDIAQRQLDSDLEQGEKRKIRLRMGDVKLAYGHIDAGYAVFLELAQGQDAVATDAAIRYLKDIYTRSYDERPDRFRLVRKELATDATPFLWTQEAFRQTTHEIARHMLGLDAALAGSAAAAAGSAEGQAPGEGEAQGGGEPAASPPEATAEDAATTARVQDAYKMLSDLAHSHQDAIALAAASDYLQHAADHQTQYNFRLVRKALQGDQFLWADRDFRVLVFDLKEKIEGSR